MQLDVTELEAWIVAQYTHIQDIMHIPVSSEEDAVRYVRCQGGVDILSALAKALRDKSDYISRQAKAENSGEEVLP